MHRTIRAVAVAAVIALVLGATSASAAILSSHGTTYIGPSQPSSIGYNGGPQPATNCSCHTTLLPSNNNNHGLYLRPITTGVQNASNNPAFASIPSNISFNLTDTAAFNYADWVIGGLSIGAERYIYDATRTVGVTATYPAIGNFQWFMDAPQTTLLGTPFSQPATWGAYSGSPANDPLNYFTDTKTLIPASTDYGCVNCHSYAATITTDGVGVPSYTIQTWGVTCFNCHGTDAAAQAHQSIDNGAFYKGSRCDMCHMRTPVPADAAADVEGRPQQLAQRIWNTGQAGRHRDQGMEVNKPNTGSESWTSPVAQETSDGAGHPDSWAPIQAIFGAGIGNARFCARCHSTQGYIAHSTNGTDVPYSWVGSGGINQVDLNDVVGVSCVACHTTHGTQVGLNMWGNRWGASAPGLPDDYEACADCHRVSQLGMVAIDDPGSTAKIATNQTISHPTREMFEGRGGYGVTNNPALHFSLGVNCQMCHMPVSTGQPEADTSHLFRTMLPGVAASPVGYRDIDKLGGVVAGSATFPDDSCTGIGCHLTSQRGFMQSVIGDRQGVIQNQLTAVKAKLNTLAPAWSANVTYNQARANWEIVSKDGSVGVHNYYYARELLNWADVQLDNLTASGSGAVPVVRVGGSDRYATAIKASRDAFANGSAPSVVVASGQVFPDALCASGLAGALNSPILLTPKAALPSGLVTELNRLGAAKVYLIGGTAAVSNNVATQLATAGFAVERVGGADRYATARNVGLKMKSLLGAGFPRKAFVVRGDTFPDALSVSPIAAGRDYCVLLTRPTALHSATVQALDSLPINEVVVVGGTVSVSNSVYAAIDGRPSVTTIARWAGSNRYATGVKVANNSKAKGWATYSAVGVASGEIFADALGGGAAIGRRGGVMLLTAPNSLPSVTRNALVSNSASINDVWIYGGRLAVSDSVRASVSDAVNP